MQNQIKNFIKKISIFTTDSDTDWKRLFLSTLLVVLGVSVWSVFFFKKIEYEIANAEVKEIKSVKVVAEKQDELRDLIGLLDEKKNRSELLLKGNSTSTFGTIPDPSR